eukprot:1107004_1
MCNFPTILAFCLYLNGTPSVALNDVRSITIQTSWESSWYPSDDITITLWFNLTGYQFSLPYVLDQGQSYTAYKDTLPSFAVLDYVSNCPSEPKLMIQNSMNKIFGGNEMEQVKFTTNSGEWYGIGETCYPWTGTSSTPQFDSSSCAMHTPLDQYSCNNRWAGPQVHCSTLNGEVHGPNSIATPIQAIYFDTTRPNTFIDDAFLKLLTQEETITCNPTQSPTLDPTTHPTRPPTITPTSYTSPPTMNPSDSPSKTPSKQPTRSPNRPLRIINLPTHNPINVVTDVLMDDEISTSSAIAYTTDHEGSNLQEMTVITSTLITAISVAVLVVLCLLIVFVYRCAFKPQKQEIVNTVQSVKSPPEKHRRHRVGSGSVGDGQDTLNVVQTIANKKQLVKIGIDKAEIGKQEHVQNQVSQAPMQTKDVHENHNGQQGFGTMVDDLVSDLPLPGGDNMIMELDEASDSLSEELFGRSENTTKGPVENTVTRN